MLDVTAFEAEINEPVDVFIGTSRSYSLREGDEPFLFVVLPSCSFKVKLKPGNLAVLSEGLKKWLPEDQQHST
jgi:hypothetical protein